MVQKRFEISRTEIDAYLQHAFDKEIVPTIAQLAENYSVSRNTMSVAASRALRVSFREHVKRRKHENGCRLLSDGTRNAHAGYRSGYRTRTGFQKMFRTISGTTAGSYRKRMSNKDEGEDAE